jgi:hypothetical protein
MAIVNGTATTQNLPNYAGELFTASPTKTPFLSMIGGLSGGRSTNSVQFITGLDYSLPEAAQPSITEDASVTAPAATAIGTEQKTNVVQIFQKTVKMTYLRQSDTGTLKGLNLSGQTANPVNQWAWQVSQKLVEIARDVEYTFLNGTYSLASTSATAHKTRGMIALASEANVIEAEADVDASDK